MTLTIEQLEKYTQENSQEVLVVKAQEGDELIEIVVFKGFSSSLTGATAFDRDLPILSDQARIIMLDRLMSPYNPTNPQYIQKNITAQEFVGLL